MTGHDLPLVAEFYPAVHGLRARLVRLIRVQVMGVVGIDPETTITDHSGRPRFLLERRGEIAELI
jgi:hypothetical protein